MYYPRYIERRTNLAMSDTRVVLICGPRQSGKTTFAQQFAGGKLPFFTLDNPSVLDAASTDPVGFLRGLDRAVIDEAHRAPKLILAIKMAVDADPQPGKFLLTGSADFMTLPHLADSLAGRAEIIPLLPLAQAELHEFRSSFLEKVFDGEIPDCINSVIGNDLIRIVLSGGYPEALTRRSWQRRQNWHLNYVDAIIQRDIQEITRINQLHAMPRLIKILAEHSGQLVNYSRFGSLLGMNHVTTQRYLAVFESLFLVRTLQAWYSNRLKRLTKSPKLHFLDAGLLAALNNYSPNHVRRNRTLFGPLLETFVFSELLKQASWTEERYVFSHFRDKERNEVDVVMEDRRGRIVGIEVKASATVSKRDFSGLRRLAAVSDDRFVMGLVLYDHDQTVPFGNRMFAAPISILWS